MVRTKKKSSPQTLGELLALARGDIPQTEVRANIPSQKTAKKGSPPQRVKNAGVYKKNVSNIEAGHEIPSLKKLAGWVATLETLKHDKDPDQKHHFFKDSEIALFLSYWLKEKLKQVQTKPNRKREAEGKIQRGKAAPKSLQDTYQEDFLVRAQRVVRKWQQSHLASTFAAPAGSGPPTLSPAGLQTILADCIVIVGASVHHPPNTILDLFRENGRLSDLMNLPLLKFGPSPLLLTDRMVISLSEEERREILGARHLLVIGGSTVNVVARFLSNVCVFRLCYDKRKYDFDFFSGSAGVFDSLRREEILQIQPAVIAFFELLKDPRANLNEILSRLDLGSDLILEQEYRLRDLVNMVREKMGDNQATYDEIMRVLSSERVFFSPLGRTLIRTDPNEASLSVITLGANAWASDPSHVCLLVMGSNSYGTAGALRVLAQQDLSARPLGGLLRIFPATAESEYVRFVNSGFQWVTGEYDIESVVGKNNLNKMYQELRRTNKPTNIAFHKDANQFQAYKDFLLKFQYSDQQAHSRKFK